MTKTNTVLDAFEEYQNQVIALGKPGEAKNMQTVLLRFTVPGWGGPIPQNSKRSTKEDVKAGLDFLGQIPIKKLKFGLDAQEQFFYQASATTHQRNNARYYLRKLINFAEENGWIEDEQPRTVKLLKLRSGSTPRLPKLTSKKWRRDYSLGSQTDDHWNSKLQAQISNLKDWFIAQNMTESSIRTHLGTCNRFLGWLVRYEHIDIEALCLEMIIPHVNLPRRSQFSSRLEYLEAKDDAIDIRQEKMEDAYRCIKRFLSFYSNNPGSRVTVLTSLINIVKFFYEDLIDPTDPLTVPPILPKLRELRNQENKKIESTPRVVPIEKKFVDYERVLQVVFDLKKEADQNVYMCRRETRVYQRPRLPKGTGKALRRFLIVGFLSFLPPDRQQLIRELKIGSSFARGTFGSGNIFIPEDEMEDSNKAGWCIILTKYKTVKTHGDVKITLPNYDFGDGTTFYQYIDKWISDYRPLFNPQDDWLFIKPQTGEQLTGGDPRDIVAKVFNKRTGKPVGPHALRHIFNTYLAEANVPEDVTRASRKLMKQSDKVADTVYTHGITDRVAAPAIDYMKDLILEKGSEWSS